MVIMIIHILSLTQVQRGPLPPNVTPSTRAPESEKETAFFVPRNVPVNRNLRVVTELSFQSWAQQSRMARAMDLWQKKKN